MNWHPITESPTQDGTYYVRKTTPACHDSRSRVRYWNISTYGYTTAAGWNTGWHFDGSPNDKSPITPDGDWEWCDAETLTEEEYRRRNGWEV